MSIRSASSDTVAGPVTASETSAEMRRSPSRPACRSTNGNSPRRRRSANLEPTGNRKQDILRVTQAVAGRLQYYVANHPEQWTVFQRRWPEAHAG